MKGFRFDYPRLVYGKTRKVKCLDCPKEHQVHSDDQLDALYENGCSCQKYKS